MPFGIPNIMLTLWTTSINNFRVELHSSLRLKLSVARKTILPYKKLFSLCHSKLLYLYNRVQATFIYMIIFWFGFWLHFLPDHVFCATKMLTFDNSMRTIANIRNCNVYIYKSALCAMMYDCKSFSLFHFVSFFCLFLFLIWMNTHTHNTHKIWWDLLFGLIEISALCHHFFCSK